MKLSKSASAVGSAIDPRRVIVTDPAESAVVEARVAFDASRRPEAVRLDALAADISAMGGRAEAQLSDVIDAVLRRDTRLAERVRADDRLIDDAYRGVEDAAMELLTHNLDGPAAREALSAVKIARELERVGDLAKNIAKRSVVLNAQPPLRAIRGVLRMGRISLGRLSEALNAYSHRNVEKALAVWGGDDEIDELYNSLFQEILAAMMDNAEHVNGCTHLVFVAKNFERVGDHATNISEAVHHFLTGARLEDARPKSDITSTSVVDPPDEDEETIV